MIVPEREKGVKSFRIPRVIFHALVFLGVVSLVLFSILSYDYYKILQQINENKHLSIENRQLKEQIQLFHMKINALTEDIYLGQSRRYGRPGRIPTSINIPFHTLVDENTGKFKQVREVKNIFASYDITPDRKVINYCGGGIAATLDAFLLHQLGFNAISVYDNSMSEWAMDKRLPIETG